jgi:hypothetical protein
MHVTGASKSSGILKVAKFAVHTDGNIQNCAIV